MSFLEEILASTRADVEKRRRSRPLSDLIAAVPNRPDERRFLCALRKPGMSVVAEFKRSSPTEGLITGSPVLEDIVTAYEEAGASALSILTEATRFGGSLDDLRSARAVSDLPILRKDFIVDRYQVLEAAEAGADAILLIVAAFDAPDVLRALHSEARERSMDVLIEVRNEKELDVALSITEDLVGINNRDLDTFEIHPERTGTLAAKAPRGTTVVSESGLTTPTDLRRLAEAGVTAALIGTALMRDPSPKDACRRFSSVPTSDAACPALARPPAFA